MDAEQGTVIGEVPTEGNSYTITPSGIVFHGETSREDWVLLGEKLGKAGRSIGFLIGDWLNFGEVKGEWGNVYDEAMRITGMEYNTLAMYARVAKKVQFSTRVLNLAFETHRKVASLKDPEDQKKWLKIAQQQSEKGKPISSRRFAKSILLGKVARDEDMEVPEIDRGRDSPQVHIQRIITFWKKKKEKDWLNTASLYRIRNLMTDLQPVLDMYDDLYEKAVELEENIPGDGDTVPVDWRE